MKAFLKIVASLLLLLNGIGAVYGGWNLITHPDGSSLNVSLDLLQHTPFQNYFIPGIILLIANGLFSFFVLIAIVFSFRNYSWLTIFQGVILLGWILIQIMLLQTFNFLHFIYIATGILLIITGQSSKKYDYHHKSFNT